MLLWINGPFGGGKTATAYELNRRLAGSVVCDPEHVGFGLRRMPAALRGNFQDMPVWRHSVMELLRLTLVSYDGPVIVPSSSAGTGRSITWTSAFSGFVNQSSPSTSIPIIRQ